MKVSRTSITANAVEDHGLEGSGSSSLSQGHRTCTKNEGIEATTFVTLTFIYSSLVMHRLPRLEFLSSEETNAMLETIKEHSDEGKGAEEDEGGREGEGLEFENHDTGS